MEKNLKQLNEDRCKIGDYNSVYFCMYGAQNYSCDVYTDNYQSDYDYKAIVIPSLKDLVFNSKPISKIVSIDNGQVDVKDIRAFFDTLMKCNPQYVECMLTGYWFGDTEFECARALMPQFVWELRESFIKACYGMMLEKFTALQHPYPSVLERLNKFGYDPKQLHHMLRLLKMMEDFQRTSQVVLVPDNREYLTAVKLGMYEVEEALNIAKLCKESGLKLREELAKEFSQQKHTYDAVNEMKQFGSNYLEKKIREEILNERKC